MSPVKCLVVVVVCGRRWRAQPDRHRRYSNGRKVCESGAWEVVMVMLVKRMRGRRSLNRRRSKSRRRRRSSCRRKRRRRRYMQNCLYRVDKRGR